MRAAESSLATQRQIVREMLCDEIPIALMAATCISAAIKTESSRKKIAFGVTGALFAVADAVLVIRDVGILAMYQEEQRNSRKSAETVEHELLGHRSLSSLACAWLEDPGYAGPGTMLAASIMDKSAFLR